MQGKIVLITGGGKRVGAAICRRLHAAGANLMLHYRTSAGEARLLQAELNGVRADSVALIQADLLDLAQAAGDGRADGADASAGSTRSSTTRRRSSRRRSAPSRPRHWDDLIGTNLRAPLFLAQAAAPALQEGAGRDRQHRRHPRRAAAQELRRLLDREGRR